MSRSSNVAPGARARTPPEAPAELAEPSLRTALLRRRSGGSGAAGGGGSVAQGDEAGEEQRTRHRDYGSTSPSHAAISNGDEHGAADARTPSAEGHDHGPARPSSLRSVVYTKNNVLDLRAAQRTFDGAYARTALAQLSYAVVILRLFQQDFYLVGIAYVVLAVGLLILSIVRYKLTMESPEETENDLHCGQSPSQSTAAQQPPPPGSRQEPAASAPGHQRANSYGSLLHDHLGRQHHRPARKINNVFRTAGDVVAFATAFVLALQIALVVLVLRL